MELRTVECVWLFSQMVTWCSSSPYIQAQLILCSSLSQLSTVANNETNSLLFKVFLKIHNHNIYLYLKMNKPVLSLYQLQSDIIIIKVEKSTKISFIENHHSRKFCTNLINPCIWYQNNLMFLAPCFPGNLWCKYNTRNVV